MGQSPIMKRIKPGFCVESIGDHRTAVSCQLLFPVIGIDDRRRNPEAVKRTVEYRKGEALRICRESRLTAEDGDISYKRLAVGEASFLSLSG